MSRHYDSLAAAFVRGRLDLPERLSTAQVLQAGLEANLWIQNEGRARALPRQVIERLMARWEVPSLLEAQAVEYCVNGRSVATWEG